MGRKTDRQALIDLIINAKRTDPKTGSFTEWLADFLLGYGVTLPQPSNELMTGWVSVNKRLPEKRKEVLVHYGNGRIGIDWIDSTQCFVFDELYGRVTHWLPIPELPDRRPPEGEEDA